MKILVVDDRPMNLKLLRVELEAEGHTVCEAANGVEALTVLRAEPCDAIISDILMPQMDGYRLCHEVRRDEQLRDLPFIFYTATYTSPGDENLSYELGADQYLRKPSSTAALLLALNKAVRRHREARRAPSTSLDELAVIREYNTRLVNKLEEKNLELEAAFLKLREEETRFGEMAEHIEDVFWSVSPDGQELLYVSPAYERMWGRPVAELRARPASWIDAILPSDRATVVAAFERLAAGETFRTEYRIQRPDGTVRWILDRGFPVRNESGAIYRCVGISSDITERKDLEEKFLRAQRLEAVGALASGIAHDLNNILAPVLMAAGLLKHKLREERDRAILGLVETGAQRGAGIVRQLLTFNRGVAGERVCLQPRHLLREMGQMMQETFPRGIEIDLKVPNDLWNVVGNATQLHQVLMNLCINARDAMPDGGTLTLGAQNEEMTEATRSHDVHCVPGSYVVLTVTDTGCGIPPEIRDRIFEAFFTTKEPGKGTGLGLATVQGIVASHGGFVELDSEPGTGTTFRVYLPATRAAEATLVAETAVPFRAETNELVLLVDDEAAIRVAAQLMLEERHYRVLTAGNGEEAIKRFLEHRGAIEAVITDVMMPGMDGTELVRSLRILDPDLKVIACTGLEMAEKRDELAALGVKELVTKPFSPAKLIGALERALGSRFLREPADDKPQPVGATH